MEARFRNRADVEIPKTTLHHLHDFSVPLGVGISIVLTLFVVFPVISMVDTSANLPWGWLAFGTFLGLSVVLSYGMDRVGLPDVKSRELAMQHRVFELAEARQRKIEQDQAFLASPEWKLLREQVIREDGKTCMNCGAEIMKAVDLTVDHIKPRSKYPELGLTRTNLQVLCRQCNSAKGAREPA